MLNSTIKACLITNPRSGHGETDLTEALEVLERQHWQITVRQKLHGGHATTLAREAAEAGFDVVVDCGGDGTLSEIVEGVIGTDVAVGTLPGGTVNLWAAEVGISSQLKIAALQLASAELHRVDVGHLSINGTSQHHFLLMAGLGIDGAVMSHVSKPLKNHIGVLAVGIAAIESLPALRTVPVRAELDGVIWQGKVSQIIVGNTRKYAGFTQVTGNAIMNDGFLDVCLITATDVLSASRQLGSLLLRQEPSADSAELYRVGTFTLHTASPLPLQLDGGVVAVEEKPSADGVLYEFSTIMQGITLLVPRTYNGELFQAENSLENVSMATATTVTASKEPAHIVTSHENTSTQKDGIEQNKEIDKSLKKVRRTVQVTGLEVDTITAANIKNKHLVRIVMEAETLLKSSMGSARGNAILSHLAIGDIIKVKGMKQKGQKTIVARKVVVSTSANTKTAQKK